MNHKETLAVLEMCAAFDARTVGEADVIAWQAALDSVAFHDAKAAVIAHYKSSRQRIMPADITAQAKSFRSRRLAAVDASDVNPPAEFADDPRRETAWLNAFWQAVGDGSDPHLAQTHADTSSGARRALEPVLERPVKALVSGLARKRGV